MALSDEEVEKQVSLFREQVGSLSFHGRKMRYMMRDLNHELYSLFLSPCHSFSLSQINQMKKFIEQEAKEKADEIQVKASRLT